MRIEYSFIFVLSTLKIDSIHSWYSCASAWEDYALWLLYAHEVKSISIQESFM